MTDRPARIFLQPIVWCVGFLFAASEIMGLLLVDGADGLVAAGSLSAFSVARIVLYTAVFIGASRIGSIVSRKTVIPLGAVLGVMGGMLLVVSGFAGMAAFAWIGFFCMAVAYVALWLCTLEFLSTLSLLWVRRSLVGGAIVNVACAPCYLLEQPWSIGVSAAFLLLSCVLLLLALLRREELKVTIASHVVRSIKYPVPVLACFFAVAFSFGFSQAAVYRMDTPTVVLTVALTKAAALLVFVLITSHMEDLSYTVLFKTIVNLTLVAFILLVPDLGRFEPKVIMAAGFALFELVCNFAIVNLASYAQTQPLRIFCAFNILSNAALILSGYALNLCLAHTGWAQPVVLCIAVLLALIAVWFFDADSIAQFFWGERVASEDGSNEAGPTSSRTVHTLAQRCGLSAREEEIASMFAAGRSAIFIAEQLQISDNTVRTHIKHVYEKCGVHSRQELITLAEEPQRETDE